MILLVGRSCSGKDAIKRELLKLGFWGVTTYTTRPPRLGEVDGISYNFLTEEDFLKRKRDGFFAETTSYNVSGGDIWYYGTALKDLSDNKVLIVNPDGLKVLYGKRELNPVSFLIDVDKDVLRKRLYKRGDNPEEAQRRIQADENDFSDIDEYIDHVIKNNGIFSVGAVADEIASIYKKERGGFL